MIWNTASVLIGPWSDLLPSQFALVIGRGAVVWLKRILIAGILMLAGYTHTKTEGLK